MSAPDAELPRHLTEEEFRALVAECETLVELQLRGRLPRNKARKLLKHHDLFDQVALGGRGTSTSSR